MICHRGASEHAHENTLEALRATFELGGDGNEFDIRKTKDGVLVVFHDDMLDQRELMKHRLQEVRGRAILDCLAHAKEPWAKLALEKGAPHALAPRVD